MTGPEPEPRLVVLTPAQRRVVGELTRDGASDGRIAHRLGISRETVTTHMRHAMRRLGAHSRAEVCVMLLRRQVVIRTENRSGLHWHDPEWREKKRASTG
jgi:DNA-binding CsgD family transcriptional regulator